MEYIQNTEKHIWTDDGNLKIFFGTITIFQNILMDHNCAKATIEEENQTCCS